MWSISTSSGESSQTDKFPREPAKFNAHRAIEGQPDSLVTIRDQKVTSEKSCHSGIRVFEMRGWSPQKPKITTQREPMARKTIGSKVCCPQSRTYSMYEKQFQTTRAIPRIVAGLTVHPSHCLSSRPTLRELRGSRGWEGSQTLRYGQTEVARNHCLRNSTSPPHLNQTQALSKADNLVGDQTAKADRLRSGRFGGFFYVVVWLTFMGRVPCLRKRTRVS